MLSDGAWDELRFWKDNVVKFNGQPIWFSAGATCTRVVFSDASSTGFGGYVVELGKEVAQGQWSEEEVGMSAAWRELKAVYNVLVSFAPKLQGHKIKWFTDNQSVKYIITNGSRKAHLPDGAISILSAV